MNQPYEHPYAHESKSIAIKVYLGKSQVDDLDRLAYSKGRERSQFVRALIDTALQAGGQSPLEAVVAELRDRVETLERYLRGESPGEVSADEPGQITLFS